MDLRKLTYFQSVATLGSFKQAAERMNVSAPAVTKAIQALESQLQVSLFERGHGGTRLTSAGKHLLKRTRRLLDEAQGIRDDMRAERLGETGKVVIGVGPIVSETLMGPALGRLAQNHPGLKLTIVSGHTESLVGQLRQFELDMVVADLSDLDQQTDLSIILLKPESLCWVVRSGHPLAETDQPLAPELLTKFCLATPTANPAYRQQVSDILGEAGANWINNPFLRSDSFSNLIGATVRSDCLTILPPAIARQHVRSGELVILDVAGWNVRGQTALFQLTDRSPSSARKAVIDALLATSTA